MKLRSPVLFLLCFFLLFPTFAGCTVLETEEGTEPEIVTHTDPPPVTNTPAIISDPVEDHRDGIDFDAAFSIFPPDTVMIRAGDLSVSWAELFAFLFRSVNSLLTYYPNGIDWSEVTGDMTLSDVILDYATEEVLTFTALEYGANLLDITFSGDRLVLFEEDVNSLIEMYGGKENLENILWENSGFYNFDVFERLFRIEFTIEQIMFDLYGEDFSLFSDDKIIDFADRNDFMMAKHILRLSAEEGDETALTEIEDIFDLLNNNIDNDDFEEFFTTIMHLHSEDSGGMISFPGGYLFIPTDMVAPFSDACAALEIGELSGIVETVYGYHIILRLPLDFDAIPISTANSGASHTLRQLAVFEDFDNTMQEWNESLVLEFSPEYNSLILADIFIWH